MSRSRLLTLSLLAALPAASLRAQAWSYPTFQIPRIVDREYNAGVADAGSSGTSVLFQWRETLGTRSQISFDAGLADPEANDASLQIFGGVGYALQLATADAELPLDFLFTAGAYVTGGDVELVRFPVGVSLGHRFPLEGDLAITPYVHPRITLGICTDCRDENDLDLNFDIGASFEVSNNLSLRAAAIIGGSNTLDDDGFGVSLAWAPRGLNRLLGGPPARRP
jgi:hypothetical protein